MPSRDVSWMDTLNLFLTISSCVIGVVVAYRISGSADDLSQSSLFVSAASFLVEKDPTEQCAGVGIVEWLSKEKKLPPPGWMAPLVQQVLDSAVTPAPTTGGPAKSTSATGCAGSASSSPAAATSDPAVQVRVQSTAVASALFSAVGGLTPRLYIQISNAGQEAGANLLRHQLAGLQLEGQSILAPGVQLVSATPDTLQLRFLKKADASEATQLASDLSSLLKATVSVNDLSAKFDADANVKARTYELWIPATFAFQ
jgi:hypothetical protein